MPTRILLLSYHYPPDLSAGSFRSEALVAALLADLPSEAQIDVLTTSPSRYSSFAVQASSVQQEEHVMIRRFELPEVKPGFVGQGRQFMSYARSVMRYTADRDYDLVIATSSRLMTGVLGAWLARKFKATFAVDFRDLFVRNLGFVLSRPWVTGAKGFFGMLEGWVVARADYVALVSEGFLPYFQENYPETRVRVFTNGIDPIFLEKAFHKPAGRVCKVVYAGNLGEGQGLDLILPDLAEALVGRADFLVLGDGARADHLDAEVTRRKLPNLKVCPPVARHELLEVYRQADVLFLHLNDHQELRSVLPSKLFEYGALGKPIWAGVAGYSAEFAATHLGEAAFIFEPCDAKAALQAFEQIDCARQFDPSDFIDRFRRDKIMAALAGEILSTAS